jgi:hypothetical protein
MHQLRYVVLRHEGYGELHFDVMFELAERSKLASWHAPSWPPQSGDQWLELGEHRSAYLEYEGSVSGNRGTVTRIASGTHQLIAKSIDRVEITCREGLELVLIRSNGQIWRCVVNEM